MVIVGVKKKKKTLTCNSEEGLKKVMIKMISNKYLNGKLFFCSWQL